MTVLRVVLFAACATLLSGCGRESVNGTYLDSVNPAVRYELRDGGKWSAELLVAVPAGMFPHGAGRRLEGSFARSGDVLELVCESASRQDPVSGQFRTEDANVSSYDHRLQVESGQLVPVGPNGEKEALFATDLNPFGARRLVPEDRQE